MNKMAKLLWANNINAETAEILRTEGNIVYVKYQGVSYRIDGLSKTVIDEVKTESKYEYIVSKNEVKKPRGWHFRDVFVDVEGNVYHKGVEQPDLKGTLESTIM